MRGPGQLEPGAQQEAVRQQDVGRREGGGEDRGGRPAVHGAAAGRRAAQGRHHQGEHGQRDPGPVRRAARRAGGVRRGAGRDRPARPGRVHPGAAAVGRHEHHHVPAEAGRHVRRQDLPRQGRGHPDRPARDILRRRHHRQAVQLPQLEHRVVRRVPPLPPARRLHAHHGQPADDQRLETVERDERAPGDHAVRGVRQSQRFRRRQDVPAGDRRTRVHPETARPSTDSAAVRKIKADDNYQGQKCCRNSNRPGGHFYTTTEIGLIPCIVPIAM